MDTFKFDFDNYLNYVQPSLKRIIIISLVTLGFMVAMEFGFYQPYTTMTIVECSGLSILNNGTGNSKSLANCFNDGVPECLDSRFNTNSKYSLSFPVSILGLKDDKYSTLILVASLISFLLEVGGYILFDYLQGLKKKRIQAILARTKIFVVGRNKHEKRITWFLSINVLVFMALKLVWIYWRDHQYGKLPCNGGIIQLVFGTTLVNSIGLVVMFMLTYAFFPLFYILMSLNPLQDLDFYSLIASLSHSTLKQFKDITYFDIDSYRTLIDNHIEKKYADQSYLTRFFKSNTFTFSTTSHEEICEILLRHQSTNPSEFTKALYSEQEVAISNNNNNNNIDDGRSDDFVNEKTKLIN